MRGVVEDGVEGDGQDEGGEEEDDDCCAEGPGHGGDLSNGGDRMDFGEASRWGCGCGEAGWGVRDTSWISKGEF